MSKLGVCETGYNIPELKGYTLVLDFDTIAAIFLNNLTTWDDQRIKDLNTEEVASRLPNKSIIVCTQSTPSETTALFTSVLSASVPEFASTVREWPHMICTVGCCRGLRALPRTGRKWTHGHFPGAASHQPIDCGGLNG
jgi:hypothetical protein